LYVVEAILELHTASLLYVHVCNDDRDCMNCMSAYVGVRKYGLVGRPMTV